METQQSEEATRGGWWGESSWSALKATEAWSVLYQPQPCQITSASLPAPFLCLDHHTHTHTRARLHN